MVGEDIGDREDGEDGDVELKKKEGGRIEIPLRLLAVLGAGAIPSLSSLRMRAAPAV
jgi:hypothetical protein